MAVGFRHSRDPDVAWLASPGRGWSRLWEATAEAAMERLPGFRGTPAAVRAVRMLASPRSIADRLRGLENFRFPGTQRIAAGDDREIVHLHNLHGGYFDLRVLPALTHRKRTLTTVHDTWMWTGHCSYTLGCDRWRSGCGACPHLDTHPPLLRDGTAANWRQKRALYEASQLHVAAPSRWLLDQARASILAPAMIEGRVIRNGIDLRVFRPGDRDALRARLGVGPGDLAIGFAANRYRSRRTWKDWPTVREALGRVATALPHTRIHLFAVGDAPDPRERLGAVRARFVPHTDDPAELATFLQAADVAVHAARPEAESCGLVVLEALACGTPVVATAVGGVPEHVRGTSPMEDPTLAALNPWGPRRADGTLVPPGDPRRMADAIVALASRPGLREALARNAARRAEAEYGLARQVDAYVSWYEEIGPHAHATPDAP